MTSTSRFCSIPGTCPFTSLGQTDDLHSHFCRSRCGFASVLLGYLDQQGICMRPPAVTTYFMPKLVIFRSSRLIKCSIMVLIDRRQHTFFARWILINFRKYRCCIYLRGTKKALQSPGTNVDTHFLLSVWTLQKPAAKESEALLMLS